MHFYAYKLLYTGGLGLAAIQIAAAAGSSVVATAGNPQKRAHLRSIGVGTAVSSRSTEYAETLAAEQRRPSVVLNSLTSPGDRPCLALQQRPNFP